MTQTQTNLEISQQRLNQFLLLTEKYRALVAKHSVEVPEPSIEILGAFLSAPAEKQLFALESLEFITELYSEAENDPEIKMHGVQALKSEVKLAKAAAQKKGLIIADESIFDHVEDGDLIELFDIRNIQFYRSWSYFKICSYTLFELLLYSWDELFIRPKWVVEQLYKYIGIIYQPGAKLTAIDVPEYVVAERLPSKHFSVLFNTKYACALLDPNTNAPAGFLVCGTPKLLPTVKVGQNIEIL